MIHVNQYYNWNNNTQENTLDMQESKKFRLVRFTHVQIPCMFSRQWHMKKGISIHSTAKSYTVYKFADRYLEYFTYYSGSSSAVWTYFLDQKQQKTHSSAFHITQSIYTLERCTLVFKTWCYFTCACLL